MDMRKNKRGFGNVWAIVGLVAAVGVITILLALYVYVLTTFGQTSAITSSANATAIVNSGINALLTIGAWMGLVVIIALITIVISLVMMSIAFVRGRNE